MAKRSKAAERRVATQQRRAGPGARRGEFATRSGLLLQVGPVVIELPRLPMCGMRFLMRRVDLLSLASSGRWPQPLSSRVAKIVATGFAGQGERAVESDNTAEELARLNETAAAIARASIIVPPEDFLDGQIDASEITREMCRPLFVAPGETPDADQLVLLPTVADSGVEGDVCYLHPSDLTQIVNYAHLLGAGALRFFRLGGGGLPGTTVEPVGEAEAAESPAE